MIPPKVSYIEGEIWWKLIRPSFKKRVTSEMNPAQFPKKSLTVGYASLCKDLNEGAPRVPKHDLGKLKNILQSEMM